MWSWRQREAKPKEIKPININEPKTELSKHRNEIRIKYSACEKREKANDNLLVFD